MAALRVVVQFTAENAQIADKQVQTMVQRAMETEKEPGCLQFEVFRSVSRPEKYALIELWESPAVLEERQRARGGGPPPLPEGVTRTIEHYEHGTH